MAAGDTLIIDGELKSGCLATTSGRAEYEVGFNAPNMPAGPNCGSSFTNGCTPNIFPAGVSASNRTKLYGKGWDKGCPTPPQIWGNNGAAYDDNDGIFKITSNTDPRCIELTDHSGCMKSHHGSGNIDNNPSQDPIRCSEAYPNAGRWAGTGLYVASGSQNIDGYDIWVHGFAKTGLWTIAMAGNVNWHNLWLRGNGRVGDSGPDGQNDTGSYSWTGGGLFYSGAGEKYPPTKALVRTRADARSTSDIHNAWTQGQGAGYGDAKGKSAQQGSWVFTGIDCFGNTSDCLDFLYNPSASLLVKQSTFEANVGSPIKSYGPSVTIENVVAMNNCSWFIDNPITYGSRYATGRTGTACNNNGQCEASENSTNCAADCPAFNPCRPANPSTVSLASPAGFSHRIINSTLGGNADAIIGITNTGTCNGTESLYVRNTSFVGGFDVNGGDGATKYYAECGGVGPPAMNMQYSFVCGTRTWATDCSGAANSTCYQNCSSMGFVTNPAINIIPESTCSQGCTCR